ncbi:hypothetical protein B0T22DRAFT_242221 [Podospora appendiculata]|uniref:Large ribosomal subunit protein bL27m n=1 Tax=Podospora appendiculata TaxID=314037 RepID=A0AAE0X6S2_9PEZI|nr:hypothetical protein B0T22DRAFT_242221 [Podospora appendiculata]
MQLIQLRRPLQRAAAGGCQSLCQMQMRTPTTPSSTSTLSAQLCQLRIDANSAVQGRRYASVKSQGAYRLKPKRTIPKKLGAKRTGDQYVIPGNILYKQRGTIWHPGENAIIGRDHTIHASAAGYVKYYRDPLRHPKRQYIGVVFDKDDKLPYPVGAARKRKLGLVAVPRKTIAVEEDIIGPSGIPLFVTRHEVEVPAATTTTAATPAPPTKQVLNSQTATPKKETPLTDGNSLLASLIQEKLKARRDYEARKTALRALQQEKSLARRGTRVLRLQSDYSYRESNWEIGRLVGDAGSVAGTEKVGSRKATLRSRRRKREVVFKGIRERKLAKVGRREEYQRRVAEKRVKRLAERAEVAKREKAKLAERAAQKAVKA